VVLEQGDAFRDTVVLTVRGDGFRIPPFFIVHTYKNASYISGRRCANNETPIRGMNASRMIDYIDHIAQYVKEPSLLIMDCLSSHLAVSVRDYLHNLKTARGEQLLCPFYLPAKTSFLLSPLDMGAIAGFKAHFYKMDRSTIQMKRIAADAAWSRVSKKSLVNIFSNCGIIGNEELESIRQRFLRSVQREVPEKLEEMKEFFEEWKLGIIKVDGATIGRGLSIEPPQQLPEGY
jgi:hypothetical protein